MKNKAAAIIICIVLCAAVGAAGVIGYIQRNKTENERYNEIVNEYLEKRAEEEANATPAPIEDFKQYTVYTDSMESVIREPVDENQIEVCKVASGSVVEYLNETQNGYMKIRLINSDQEGWLPSYTLKSAFSYSLSDLTIVDADSGVYTFNEFEDDVIQLKEQYPAIVDYRVLGTTTGGRPVYDLMIGSPYAQKNVLITAGERGCDVMTSILLMKQAEYYAHYYSEGTYDDISYTDVLNNVRFHVVAMANPDALALSQGGFDSLTDENIKTRVSEIYNSDRLEDHGSNIRYKYFEQWEANLNGIDISKNFPSDIEWFEQMTQPSSSDYPGETPISAEESTALNSLLENFSIDCIIEYRTTGSQIVFKYDAENDTSVRSAELAIALADLSLYDINIEPPVDELYGSLYYYATFEKDIPGFAVLFGDSETTPIPYSDLQMMWLKHRESWMAIGAELLKDTAE